MNDELKLVYVSRIGRNYKGETEYEFLFSTNPDNVWNESWNELCPSACGNLYPSDEDIDLKRRVVTEFDMFVAQDNNCYSMQDMKDDIIPCAWFNDEQMDVMRIMPYGMLYSEVEKLLSKSEIKMLKVENGEEGIEFGIC